MKPLLVAFILTVAGCHLYNVVPDVGFWYGEGDWDGNNPRSPARAQSFDTTSYGVTLMWRAHSEAYREQRWEEKVANWASSGDQYLVGTTAEGEPVFSSHDLSDLAGHALKQTLDDPDGFWIWAKAAALILFFSTLAWWARKGFPGLRRKQETPTSETE